MDYPQFRTRVSFHVNYYLFYPILKEPGFQTTLTNLAKIEVNKNPLNDFLEPG